MRVLLVVNSSTGYLGATDVDQKGGSSGFAAKWMAKWLESTGYARMKAKSDAEQSLEHLLKAVKSVCTADLILQRAPVKSHQSQGHDERAVRLVENQCRGLFFDVQERRKDPISSAASAWILRHSSLASQQISATQRRSDIFRTTRRKSIQISDSSVARDGGEFDTSRSKTWRSSRGCERNISINVGCSHRGKRRTSRSERDWTCRTCKNSTTRCGEREQWFRRRQAQRNSFRLSNLMVTTWKSKRDGLRRQDAERPNRHRQTNT